MGIRRVMHRTEGGRRAAPSRRYGLAALAIVAALAPALASACARDGVPSVSLNGRLAVLNHSASRHLVLATWSPFIFARSAQRRQVVTLAENNHEVARALPHEAFGRPWRWDFGDRSHPVYGTRVRHTYQKAGTYRITVLAYFPVYTAWQPFDEVTIHVR